MNSILKKYNKADDIVWAQEEPRNMGAYSHLLMHFEGASKFRVCSRKTYAAPASGSSVRSKMRQAQIIKSVFNKDID